MKCEIQLQRIHYCEAKRSFQYRCSARVSVRGCGMLSGSVGVVRECECEGVWDVEWISGCGEGV